MYFSRSFFAESMFDFQNRFDWANSITVLISSVDRWSSFMRRSISKAQRWMANSSALGLPERKFSSFSRISLKRNFDSSYSIEQEENILLFLSFFTFLIFLFVDTCGTRVSQDAGKVHEDCPGISHSC